MAKQPESPRDRLQQVPLWQWGALLIIGGLLANFAGEFVMPPPAGEMARRGQAFGRAVAALLFIGAGIVLIVVHFTRKPPPKKKALRK